MAVIDSDAHVLETERTWAYMLESECALRPRIVATPEDESSGGESWFVDGVYVGKARNVGHDTSKESREMEDLEARLKHMDELGVDIQVLYPTIFLRPYTKRPDLELAVTRSYNRWLVDIWKYAPERLRRLRHFHAWSRRRQKLESCSFLPTLRGSGTTGYAGLRPFGYGKLCGS